MEGCFLAYYFWTALIVVLFGSWIHMPSCAKSLFTLYIVRQNKFSSLRDIHQTLLVSCLGGVSQAALYTTCCLPLIHHSSLDSLLRGSLLGIWLSSMFPSRNLHVKETHKLYKYTLLFFCHVLLVFGKDDSC